MKRKHEEKRKNVQISYNGYISKLLQETEELVKNIPLDPNAICNVSDIGFSLFTNFHKINLNINKLNHENINYLDVIIRILINERIDWLDVFLHQFPVLFLTQEFEYAKIKNLILGITYLMSQIQKVNNEKYKTFIDKIIIINECFSRYPNERRDSLEFFT